MPFWERIDRYMPMAAGTSPITVSRYIAVSSWRSPSDCAASVSAVRAITRMRPRDGPSTQRRRDAEISAEKTVYEIAFVFSALVSASLRLCVETNLAIEAISQAAHVAQVARLCRV